MVQEVSKKLTEMLQTLVEAARECLRLLTEGNQINTLLTDMRSMVCAIKGAVQAEEADPAQELSTRCENILYSLDAVDAALAEDIDRALMKLEFELLPLLRIGHARFYYDTQIKGDPERESVFWESEAVELAKNEYVEEAQKAGRYAYDLTIYVLAYNKLEVTKMCLAALLENIPWGLRCELILINHGSSDGTKEYLEQIAPDKQIDIKINSNDGLLIAQMIIEGKYVLNLSNDVLLSRNAAEIMYMAMEEDPQIAYGVPITPNISNLQAIPPKEFSYGNMEEYQAAARRYNHRNPFIEERRTRLLPPLFMCRTEYWTNSNLPRAYARMLFQEPGFMFGDDKMSLYFRRAGFQNVLFRDVYCHHFQGGSSTGADARFLEGRKAFFDSFGVDAWENGFCWSYALFQSLSCDKMDAERILGINGGIGSDPLKIKEELKAKTGNFHAKLINYTLEERFLADLRGVSDEAYYVPDWEALLRDLEGEFDYIIVCDGLDKAKNCGKYIAELYRHLCKGGTLVVQSIEQNVIDLFMKQYPAAQRVSGDSRLLCCVERPVPLYEAFCKKES